jgi:hypothetical protein
MDIEKIFDAMAAKRPDMMNVVFDSRSHHEPRCGMFDGKDCDCDGYHVFTFPDECWRVSSSGEVTPEKVSIWYMEHQGPPGVCQTPGCQCGAHGEKYMHAPCHPTSGLYVSYDDLGTLTVSCQKCRQVLRRFAVAFLDNELIEDDEEPVDG